MINKPIAVLLLVVLLKLKIYSLCNLGDTTGKITSFVIPSWTFPVLSFQVSCCYRKIFCGLQEWNMIVLRNLFKKLKIGCVLLIANSNAQKYSIEFFVASTIVPEDLRHICVIKSYVVIRKYTILTPENLLNNLGHKNAFFRKKQLKKPAAMIVQDFLTS